MKRRLTRRERLKSAPNLRLKKRKTIFLEKNEIFEKNSFQKSRRVPKNVKGDPSGFINIHSVAKYQKPRRGDPLGTLKNFQKKSHKAEKKSKGGTL